MANLCDNTFYLFCENSEILTKIIDKINHLFENNLYGEICACDANFIEGYFESKWSFPIYLFENFFDEFENEDIYMRCLSTEYGMGYVAMNIYENGAWRKEQTFDL